MISHEQTQSNRVRCFPTCRITVFPKDPQFQIIDRSQQLSLCRVAAVKRLPYNDKVLLSLHFLVICDYNWIQTTESRIPLKSVLGDGWGAGAGRHQGCCTFEYVS